MKCLILAAGYATRLYPLTENFPKPLLEVKGKAILDWLVDDIEASRAIEAVDQYIVVTNHKFAAHFKTWADKRPESIAVVDDGTLTNETRLGAVKDICMAVEDQNVDDDLLVIAGDNLLDFSLGGFMEFFKDKKTTCTMRFYEADVKRLTKTGVATIEETTGRILSMVEKPANPTSNWCIPPFYIYRKQDLPLFKKAIEGKCCGVDAPGSFIAWLCTQVPVHAYEMPGKRYDIGNLESYSYANEHYPGVAPVAVASAK